MTHLNMAKAKPVSRVNNQQAAFELKQRVLLALNKLADRDTHDLGVEDLEKTIECLPPDGISPFLSCISDTDSEKKSAVRRECIRLMGLLAVFHGGLIGPHLNKVVASIVKRLKDSDSVVRDACVETVGVLASRLSTSMSETDGLFVVLVRPLFEALGEQNKHVQCGSALCLSRVVDSIHDPPPKVMQKMLGRTVKLLRNPHFMAKPAVIELNRSIILAGGTPTHSSLNAALTSIQESLKNSDWATRKAGCAALGDIATCGAACLASFRASCIRCLESCRFDKVKPVRDAALQALQLWKNLLGTDSPEPSDTGSSIKGTPYRDEYGDITSASDTTLKGNKMAKFDNQLASKRAPLSTRKFGRISIEKSAQSLTNDWKVEIAIPKSRQTSVTGNPNDESNIIPALKGCERMNFDARSSSNIGYQYAEVDDKHDCSSVSNLFSASMKPKVITAHYDASDDVSLVKSTGTSQRFAADEISIEEKRCLARLDDRRSLDSTITESASRIVRDCCSQTEKDMVLIRQHLLEIENKQSGLIDMLRQFTTSVMDSVSMVHMKVSNLEAVVDKLAQDLVHGERYSDVTLSNYGKRSLSIVSPRLSSTCTPRPSVDSNKQPSLLPNKYAGSWGNSFTRNKSNSFGKQNREMWTDVTLRPSKSYLAKGNPSSFCPETNDDQIRKGGGLNMAPATRTRLNKEIRNNHWKVQKDYLCYEDLDSAYVQAMGSRNKLLLFDLMDRTGPILENLSNETASQLLCILATYLMEPRFVNCIIPWLQQLVDLCNIHGMAYLMPPAKAKQEILNAIQEASKLDVCSPAERKCVTEIGKTLCQFWGNGPC